MSPFDEKKHKRHSNATKSILINALQGMASARIDREHYTHFTVEELCQKLESAKAAQNSGSDFQFVYRKEKSAKK